MFKITTTNSTINEHRVITYGGVRYYISKKGNIKYSPTKKGALVELDLYREIKKSMNNQKTKES